MNIIPICPITGPGSARFGQSLTKDRFNAFFLLFNAIFLLLLCWLLPLLATA